MDAQFRIVANVNLSGLRNAHTATHTDRGIRPSLTPNNKKA